MGIRSHEGFPEKRSWANPTCRCSREFRPSVPHPPSALGTRQHNMGALVTPQSPCVPRPVPSRPRCWLSRRHLTLGSPHVPHSFHARAVTSPLSSPNPQGPQGRRRNPLSLSLALETLSSGSALTRSLRRVGAGAMPLASQESALGLGVRWAVIQHRL